MDVFAEPIKRGGFSNASPMQVQLAYRCALVLKDLVNPYLLRRQKKDIEEVSRMPGKTEQVLGNDDMETLETVMKGKGLAGVFDHDFVDSSDVKKSLAV